MMTPSQVRYALAALALLALSLAPVRARADCGAAGCPLEARGSGGNSPRFSLDAAYLSIDKDQTWLGSHSASLGEVLSRQEEIRTFTRSVVVVGRAQLSNHLAFSASQSFMDRLHHHLHVLHPGHFLNLEWTYQGAGDLTTTGWFAPGADGFTARTGVVFQGALKLPSGRRHVDAIQGEEPNPPDLPSTGSLDEVASAQFHTAIASQTLRGDPSDVPVTVTAMFRNNGRGTDDYRIGNEAQLSLATCFTLIPAVRLLGQLSAQFTAKDETGSTYVQSSNTGGTLVLATPGLQMRITPSLSTYAYYQMRAFQRVNGIQLVTPRQLLLGTSYSFDF